MQKFGLLAQVYLATIGQTVLQLFLQTFLTVN